MQNEVNKIYKNIQSLIINLIPENWKSICLYASIMQSKKGEMYFYYFPKKIIKANPVNCYEIPDKFGLDERTYNNELKKLYSYIQSLNNYVVPSPFTNVTIIIEKDIFTIRYNYEDLENSRYNDEQRRIVWGVKNLQIPLESLNLANRTLVETYKEDAKINPTVYSEKIKIDNIKNQDYTINQSEDEQIINPILKI